MGTVLSIFTRSTKMLGTSPKSKPGSETGLSGLTNSTESLLLSSLPLHGPNMRTLTGP
jgi:hypothetical protein